MKKTGLLFALIIMAIAVQSQEIVNTFSKNITVGFDVFNDIVTKSPADYNSRVINQGFSTFATYNFKVGDSPHVFGIGAGIRTHNFYSDNIITDVQADVIEFMPIGDSLTYKKSKLNLVYLDFPAEFRFHLNKDMKIGIGFKVGVLIDSKTKYVGQLVDEGATSYIKEKKINGLETISFGPTLRIGYKWINVFAYYQPSKVFTAGKGPEFYPLSVGITIMPF